jgi:hypothetical protein
MKTKTRKRLHTHFEPYPHEHPSYSANVKDNGRDTNTFKWHFPRGMLSPRMSGLELCEFVLNHMQGVICCGLLSGYPQVEAEFKAMFVKLSTSPREVIDRILPWIRVEYHEHDDDIIHMSLFDQTEQKSGPVTFDLGAA